MYRKIDWKNYSVFLQSRQKIYKSFFLILVNQQDIEILTNAIKDISR